MGHSHVGAANGHPTPAKSGRTLAQTFFTISGFILTWLSLKDIKPSGEFVHTRFLERRALQILPALLL